MTRRSHARARSRSRILEPILQPNLESMLEEILRCLSCRRDASPPSAKQTLIRLWEHDGDSQRETDTSVRLMSPGYRLFLDCDN